MYLSYNNVQLKLLTLDNVVREAVWTPDGVDLLYVRWKIGCSCVYAAGATALEFEPVGRVTRRTNLKGNDPPNIPLVQGNNTLPIVTDVYIRNTLNQHRKPLRIWGYRADGSSVNWLVSPQPGTTCDADNGPKIHVCNVVSATGAPSSFAVQLEIETCLPPSFDGSDRPILGHRWQMTHTHDEDYYLTRTVDGEAVFHPGLLDSFKQNPDWFRQQLFHPIPLGFKRTLGPITLSSDGCVLKYQYSDTDTKVVFSPGNSGATKIDIQENVTYISPKLTTLPSFGLL